MNSTKGLERVVWELLFPVIYTLKTTNPCTVVIFACVFCFYLFKVLYLHAADLCLVRVVCGRGPFDSSSFFWPSLLSPSTSPPLVTFTSSSTPAQVLHHTVYMSEYPNKCVLHHSVTRRKFTTWIFQHRWILKGVYIAESRVSATYVYSASPAHVVALLLPPLLQRLVLKYPIFYILIPSWRVQINAGGVVRSDEEAAC